MEYNPASFYTNLFYKFLSDWINQKKGQHFLLTIQKIFDDLSSIIDAVKFETNYSNIYQDKLRLVKENSDNYEASFGFRY